MRTCSKCGYPGHDRRTCRTVIGDDGQQETLCDHGVGHGGGIHTCDGCCVKEKA